MADENIKYGFFDSSLDPETGDYDRLYSAESFNSYFSGLITEFGIVWNYGEHFNISFPTSVDDDMITTIHSGKAFINRHWFEVNNAVNITLPEGPRFDYRWDSICIVLDVNERTIDLGVHSGNVFSASTESAARLSTEYIPSPIGYIGVDAHGVSRWVDDGSGIFEMPIWHILRYSGENKSNPYVEDNRWKGSCPRISSLAPNAFDVEPTTEPYNVPYTFDQYLKTYKDSFSNWFYEVKNDLRINTNFAFKRWSFLGSTTKTFTISDPSFPVEDNCMISVYMNGFKMSESEYTSIVSNGTAIVNLTKINSFSTSNELVIEILQGAIDSTAPEWDYEVENPDTSSVFTTSIKPVDSENINQNWIIATKFDITEQAGGAPVTFLDFALDGSGLNRKIIAFNPSANNRVNVTYTYVKDGVIASGITVNYMDIKNKDISFTKNGMDLIIDYGGDISTHSNFFSSDDGPVDGFLSIGGRSFTGGPGTNIPFNGTVSYLKFKVVR